MVEASSNLIIKDVDSTEKFLNDNGIEFHVIKMIYS